MKAIVALMVLGQVLTPPVRPDESAIVNVQATSPWTDTGIVVQPGDRIEMRAWGTIKSDGTPSPTAVGPAGSGPSTGSCEYVVTDPHVPASSLVANVAETLTFDGRGFLIGTRWKGTVPIAGTTAATGHLFLGFNDRAMMCDRSGYDSWAFRNRHSGAFTASITITRRH